MCDPDSYVCPYRICMNAEAGFCNSVQTASIHSIISMFTSGGTFYPSDFFYLGGNFSRASDSVDTDGNAESF